MQKINTTTIETERLLLERTTMKYVQEIFKEFTDEVTKYLRASTPKKIEEEEQRIMRTQEKYVQGTAMSLIVTDAKGDFIGSCEIMRLDTPTPELGLRIKESARGKGYGREMIGSLIKRLENHKKFEYITYRACTENIGSRKIAENFGGVLQLNEEGKENIFLQHKFDDSSSFEAVEYRIYPKKNIDIDVKEFKLETENLLLIPVAKEHAQEYFDEFTDEITRFMYPSTPKSIDDISQWIEKKENYRENNNDDITIAILDKKTGEFIGGGGLHEINTQVPQFGIWIKKGARGKKYGKESIQALNDWAKKNLEYEYILYPVDKDNIGSRKIAESLGGLLVKDGQGNERVVLTKAMNPEKILNTIEYRIYKKLSLPAGLQITKDISDTDYEQMIHFMKKNDIGRYLIDKKDFYRVRDGEKIVGFGRLFEIGPKQLELGSIWVDETQRGKKLGLIVSQELIKDRTGDNEIFLATRKPLEQYYQTLGFQIITKNIPEKLVHTGIWATEHGIDFIIMKLA